MTWSFAQARQAAADVRAAPLRSRAVATMRPRGVVGLVRSRAPLSVLLFVAARDGRIHCDGTYIGQSVLPLVNAVRYWRDALPRGHRVGALVVVYPTAEGDLALPATVAEELAWTRGCDAIRALRARLPRGRPASARAVAVLVAATAGK